MKLDVIRALPALLLAAACPDAALAQRPHMLEMPAAAVEDKIRGGLLGQILGDLNGLRYEMKFIDEPGEVAAYTPELPEGAWTDDDTDIEWVYLVEIGRARKLTLSPAEITAAWKRHANRRFWCSNQYLRQLMDLGIDPPLTGHLAFNPWADFNLSGQFLSETWGLVAPAMPRTAARLAEHYTAVGIEGEPSQSARMFASMIATAFTSSDMDQVLDAGAGAVDPASAMAHVMADIRRWHREHPGDWRATRKLVRDTYARYGGHDMRDRNGVILNGASTIAALLYGKGDFVETVRYAFNFGWDCDNNAATSGTVVGVMRGYKWIMGRGWNIRDRFRNTSRDDMPEDETITSFGTRLVDAARLALRENGGEASGSVWRIPAERPEPAPLVDFAASEQALRAAHTPEIERAVAGGAQGRDLARAAYFAICLGLAPSLKARDGGRWSAAVAALEGYPRVLQVLFYQSEIPAGDRLRERALAAGVHRPEKIELW